VIARLFGVEEIIEAMFYFNFVSLVRCATFAPPRCAAAAPVRGAVPRNFAPAQRPSDAPALGANRRRQSPAQRCARIDSTSPPQCAVVLLVPHAGAGGGGHGGAGG
jgi:hypothetical protein